MADEVKYKVAEDFKATVKLYSGKEVVIDMMKVSTKEWKTAVRVNTSEEEEYKIVSKATGLAVLELENLSQPDYRLIVDAFIRIGTQPLTNPT